jgi:hypothetical protein
MKRYLEYFKRPEESVEIGSLVNVTRNGTPIELKHAYLILPLIQVKISTTPKLNKPFLTNLKSI